MQRLIIILIALVLVSLPVVGFSSSDQRVALVIGNSAYKNAPLRNPANDATDMALMLKRLGFKVTLKTNATRRSMQEAIRTLGKQLRSGGVGLFYYAGHGVQVDGSNYLIPVKTNIEFKADVEYEAVDAGRILSYMEDAGNGINIIILDACRNNPYSRSFRSGVNGLVKMDAPSGSILAFSTAPGSVAADGTGRNGLYTSKLLKYMATPNVKIETVFKKVRIDVARASGKKQTPWESSSLMGDFYFYSDKTESRQSARAISVEKRQSPQNLNAEEEMWEFVKISSVIDDYTMFLDQYPNSRFSGAANLRIQQLKRKQNAQTMTAAVAPAVVKPATKPVASNAGGSVSDGNYVKYSNGIVYDKTTNLEWYVGPDEDTSWYEADKWVKSLDVGDGGWRMPRIRELKTLYRKGAGRHNMASLFKTKGTYVWSVDKSVGDKSRSDTFSFKAGSKFFFYTNNSNYSRAFAVRSRKGIAHIKSETKQQNEMHASISPAVVDQSRKNNRKAVQKSYRMALFPSHLYASGESKFLVPTELLSIEGIASIASEDDRLTLKYCYRELKGATEGVLPLKDITKNHIWKKKSLFSKRVPDWEVIRKIGQKIDVNLIILVTGDVSRGQFKYYLYDTVDKKIYTKEDRANPQIFGTKSPVAVNSLIKDFFKQQ